MKRIMTQLVACAALAAALAIPAMAGAGGVVAKTEPSKTELKPRDLTPVTWMQAPAHPPIEFVRDGKPRAVVYVVDPKGREPFVPKRRGELPPLFKQLVDQLLEVVRLGSGALPA
jgi:hypothetical protein